MPHSSKPVFIYDGDCSFCRMWIDYWKDFSRDAVTYDSFEPGKYLKVPQDDPPKSAYLITGDGEVLSAAAAVFRTLSYAGKNWPYRLYRHVPAVASLSEFSYRFIARHRNLFYWVTRLLWGKTVRQPTYVRTRWLFLKLLGLVYFIAFVSLGTQVIGLVGQNGVSPATQFLQAVREHTGGDRFYEFPTLGWISSSDLFLQTLCWSGAFLSLLLAAGIAPALVAFILWVLYLSLFVLGQEFLSFQWDILLLETGFLAIFVSPWGLFPSQRNSPPRPVVWLFRLLLFRLMFFSGFVKLASGDSSWRNLTTLTFHYETQPLPTPVAWYVHQLPPWVHAGCCAVMFLIELGMPLLIFFPRIPRLVAAASFSLLMVLISVTGNYTFFNLLALGLCVFLFDDRALKFLTKPGVRSESDVTENRSVAARIVAPVVIALNVFLIAGLVRVLPETAYRVLRLAAPLHIVNSYGLFANMTNPRPEIVLEGSDDGVNWKEYEFKYKPGDPMRDLPWVAPHQPRLDWQMWFAALGSYQQDPWFVNLCVRLLQGSPDVAGLFAKNPFPAPPRYIRGLLYEYHFTDLSTRKLTGAVWRRELKGFYLPAVSLK